MNTAHKLLLAAVLGLAGLSPVQAIVVNGGYGAARALADAVEFSNVVRLSINGSGVCTGTLISATTILTAKHCTEGIAVTSIFVTFDRNGNGALDAGDQVNSVFEKFEAPHAPSKDLTDGTDLAMLKLDGSRPSWATSYQQLWDGNVLGSLVTMVGYGGQGVNALTLPAGNARWVAQNIADQVGAALNRPNSANIISTDFDNPVGQGFPPLGTGNTLGAAPVNSSPTALFTEGTTAGGDSGGPLFVDVGGKWLIAGVLSGGSDDASSFGDISWWTGVGNYRAAIEEAGGEFLSPIPEPATWAMALMGLCAFGALGRRRRLR